MMRIAIRLLAAAALLSGQAALAQAAPDEAAPDAPSHAIGADIFLSTDADDTQVVRAGVNFDLIYHGPDDYLGVRLEKASFNPLDQGWQGRERAYLRLAQGLGGWKLNVRAGTDGDTILGAASIHNEARFRQEYFVEREILETPQGLSQGLYYTFAGAALDLPADDRNVLTLVAGLQAFSGNNVRTHLRATAVHVLKPEWGLSAQLRGRYFHSSDPGEYDYYSPRWYAEVLPVLQIRRFDGGWRYSAAAGLGAQRDSESGWRSSRYFNAQATSPDIGGGWAINGAFTYSNVPVTSGSAYSYGQFNLGLTKAF